MSVLAQVAPLTVLALMAFLNSTFAWCQTDDVAVVPVAFSNDRAVLSGDFYNHPNPIAALVLVHGSGPTTRIANVARLFARNGFSVLTWDKRGVGQSSGIYEGDRNSSPENLALLASDAAVAMAWLLARPEVRDLPVGYWGISQAGWIIPLAALKTPQADFITLWSGPVCTVIEEIEAGIGSGGNLSSDGDSRALIAQLRGQRMDTDPRDALRKLEIPGLWLFGGNDNTMPVKLSIDRLSGLISEGQANFEFRLAPDGGHNMNFQADRPAIDAMIEWMRMRRNIR